MIELGIVCEGCSRLGDSTTLRDGFLTTRAIRADLTSRGWHCRASRDVCPDCWADGVR